MWIKKLLQKLWTQLIIPKENMDWPTQILRLEISEMLHVESVPPKVSIVEGVEIAKIFSTDDSSRFVNGILDSYFNDKIKGN